MRILILGPSGQIGHDLAENAGTVGEVITAGRSAADIIIDPLNKTELSDLFSTVKPDIVINAIAYTAVDIAETDKEQAFLLNADLPAALADHCEQSNSLLIHYSTDFIFDGTNDKPYQEDDPTHPLSIYGRSKLAGEKAIQTSSCPGLILRTSWVYGERGSNFLLTMIRLAKERESISVVDD
ncbi:MAG: NAD(P)-dependent oxidoreductase, partial [Gammaproteobacteria bacterium]|nr:NAD(P)-dependent oxidoreductase [Gammaproteobacteria bacterium]